MSCYVIQLPNSLSHPGPLSYGCNHYIIPVYTFKTLIYDVTTVACATSDESELNLFLYEIS